VISFLVDHNFNEDIVDGLTRRDVTLEFTYVRDVGLAAAPDPTMLECAATAGLVLLTHDRKTVPSFAYARVAARLPMPGVSLVSGDMPLRQVPCNKPRAPARSRHAPQRGGCPRFRSA
jgi:Domain of unknown function (DUF5615)